MRCTVVAVVFPVTYITFFSSETLIHVIKIRCFLSIWPPLQLVKGYSRVYSICTVHTFPNYISLCNASNRPRQSGCRRFCALSSIALLFTCRNDVDDLLGLAEAGLQGRHPQIRRSKTANISKDDITSQHSDNLMMCCKVISSFEIFAVVLKKTL